MAKKGKKGAKKKKSSSRRGSTSTVNSTGTPANEPVDVADHAVSMDSLDGAGEEEKSVADNAPETVTKEERPVSPDIETKDEKSPSATKERPKNKKCPHLKAAVRVTRLKRQLSNTLNKGLYCMACKRDKAKKERTANVGSSGSKDNLSGEPNEEAGNGTSATSGDSSVATLPSSLWLCLHCCEVHCGEDDHAHISAHYDSKQHDIAMNLETRNFWCFACDAELLVGPNQNQILVECRAEFDKLVKNGKIAMKMKDETEAPTSVGRKLTSKKPSSPQQDAPQVPGLSILGKVGKEIETQTPSLDNCNKCITYTRALDKYIIPFERGTDTAKAPEMNSSPMLASGNGSQLEVNGTTLGEPGTNDNTVESTNNLEPQATEALVQRQPSYIMPVMGGDLTTSLARFLILMRKSKPSSAGGQSATTEADPAVTSAKSSRFSGSKSRSKTVNPDDLFSSISAKWQMYKGLRQQDSHELLRRLLDGVQDEQIKEIRRLSGRKRGKPPRTFIDETFGGNLVSVIVCDACKHISYSFEDYMDVSIPIVQEGGKKGFAGFLTSKGLSISRPLRRSPRLSPQTSNPSGPSSPLPPLSITRDPSNPPTPANAQPSPVTSPVMPLLSPTPPPTLSETNDNNNQKPPAANSSTSTHAEPQPGKSMVDRMFDKVAESMAKLSVGGGGRSRSNSRSREPSSGSEDTPLSPSPLSPTLTFTTPHLRLITSLLRATSEIPNSNGLGIAPPSPGGSSSSSVVSALSSSWSSKTSLQKCLSAFLAVDVLEGENSWACDGCQALKEKVGAEQQSVANGHVVAASGSDKTAEGKGKERATPASIVNAAIAAPTIGVTKDAATVDLVSEVDDVSNVSLDSSSSSSSVSSSVVTKDWQSTIDSSSVEDQDTLNESVSSIDDTIDGTEKADCQGKDAAPSDPGQSADAAVEDDEKVKPSESDPADALEPIPTSPSPPADTAPLASLPSTDKESPTNPAEAPSSKPAEPKSVLSPRAFKRFLLYSCPEVLVLHLKRFQQVGLSGKLRKVDEWVKFDQYLDLTPYMAPVEVVRSKILREERRKEKEKKRKEMERKRAEAMKNVSTEDLKRTHQHAVEGGNESGVDSKGVDGKTGSVEEQSKENGAPQVDQGVQTKSANDDTNKDEEEEDDDDDFDEEDERSRRGGLYRLYGIVVHSGSLFGGHYVAYIRLGSNPPPDPSPNNVASSTNPNITVSASPTANATAAEFSTDPTRSPRIEPVSYTTTDDWVYISDSHVRRSTWEEVSKCQAYLLFYERIPIG
ncbi:Ubiquitin carboxyl-terminal hydrolase 16 [Quaeritorhiza haematococci]|nr:Ubiquitin carboxyl-terminal hydrolase 16 [Quaeritorhiza haematococci]